MTNCEKCWVYIVNKLLVSFSMRHHFHGLPERGETVNYIFSIQYFKYFILAFNFYPMFQNGV